MNKYSCPVCGGILNAWFEIKGIKHMLVDPETGKLLWGTSDTELVEDDKPMQLSCSECNELIDEPNPLLNKTFEIDGNCEYIKEKEKK